MATKKGIDKKLIASKQDYELTYICKVWFDGNMKHLPMGVLKNVVSKIGKSRRNVYAVLRYLGYHFDPRKKK